MTVDIKRNVVSFRQREPLTCRLAGILKEYPDGTQIARELLQNSEDACSRVQWYLLDHRHHHTDPERLFNPGMQAYQGPALLAGNDSVFKEGDFKSMQDLAASGKKDDESKIGQMGIGFNSVYHMTDTPSFISGDQITILEPHDRILNGGERGTFTDKDKDARDYSGVLDLFAAREKIDFSKRYEGTIFRFPLRTDAQAEVSDLSKSAYPAEKVRDMLMNLKNEAIKCLLFLKYIEKMVIYERRESDPTVYKLFEIEIVNNTEVRAKRQAFMAQLKSHVYASDDDDRDKTLQYAIRPVFRLTHEDGTTTEEEWAVMSYIGNVPEARRIMKEEYQADISNQRMIPWVGLAVPVDPKATVGTSNLFCFLPLGIHTPHPVHINGHFAVKVSRREIWTNFTGDISKDDSQSDWNEFLFKHILPVAYARFLDSIGTSHGASYDLWPRSRESGLGMESLWKDLLRQCIEEVTTNDDLKVFFAESADGEPSAVSYQMATIADPAMDEYPLLLDLLKGMVNLVCDVPENIVSLLRQVVDTTGVQDNILTPQKVRDMLRERKHSWKDSTSDDAKVQILNYCIRDDQIMDLEGLPLLPMADGSWVEFQCDMADSRYLINSLGYRVLTYANSDIVNNQQNGLPVTNGSLCDFGMFMSPLQKAVFVTKVRDTFDSELYDGEDPPHGAIAQPSKGLFPSTEWITDVWSLLRKNRMTEATLEPLLGYHLVPIEKDQLAPLDRNRQVIHRVGILPNNIDADQVLDLLGSHFGCYVARKGVEDCFSWWSQCFVSVTDVEAILTLLANTSDAILAGLTSPQRQLLCDYVSATLSTQGALRGSQRQSLERLPIYQRYNSSDLLSLQELGGVMTSLVCQGFSSEDYSWKLSSATLLKEDQPMSTHLLHVLKMRTIQESEYWYQLISEMAKTNSDNKNQWNPIMTTFLPSFYRHSRERNFKALLGDIPFVDVESKSPMDDDDVPSMFKMSPKMVVSRDLAQFFFQDEAVFPAGIYSQSFNLPVLAELGMITRFDSKFATGRLRKISYISADFLNNNSADTLQVITDFFARLNVEADPGYLDDSAFVKCFEDLVWVPAQAQTNGPFRLYKPGQCRPRSESLVIGSQCPISSLECTNKHLLSLMGWSNPPPLQAVLANLLDLSAQSLAGHYPENFEESIQAIYRTLSDRILDPQAVSVMKNSLGHHRCILINRSLHAIDRVAIKIRSECKLDPHFIQVPDSGFVELFRALGVREEVTPKDMEGILITINSGYQDGDRLSDDDAGLVVRLLETIASFGSSEAYSPDMLILTEDSQLRKLSDVVYNNMADSSGLQEDSASHVFSNNRISKSVATKLHIQMLSERIWDSCNDDFFQNWEQEISVVDSIRQILNDYGPENILTEYLQNAADAGASEFSIMFDNQSYSHEGILNETMSVGQGPALLIWNNAEFTQQDFEGLRKMAMGSKRHDSKKIGRHGLGFNTAYHLTDLPSVVSGRHLVIFDPKHAYLPKRQTMKGMTADGAVRIEFIESQLSQKFPGQVAPYQGRFGCDMTTHFRGTLFRLPLRRFSTIQNRDSNAFGEKWDSAKVTALIERWAEDAEVSLLFLKQVKTLSLVNQTNTWTVQKESEPLPGTFDATDSSSVCKVRIKTSGPRDKPSVTSKWLVATDKAYPEEVTSTIREIAQKKWWIPHRGIALPLDQPKGEASLDFKGRVFSYLPTPISTDLPFHVHGDFALTSNRKGLVQNPAHSSDAAKWNDYMLSTLLPSLIVQIMSCLLRLQFDCLETRQATTGATHAKLRAYFNLWPLACASEVAPMVEQFWKLAYTSPIFPIRPLIKGTDAPVVQGFSGKDVCFPLREVPQAVLPIVPKLEQLLRENDVPLCECVEAVSDSALYHWSKASLPVTVTDASLLREILRGNKDFMLKISSQDGRNWLLELLLGVLLDKEQDGIDHLNGLPLLPLEDNSWVSLCRNPAYYTASATARKLFKNHKTLVKESVFATPKLGKILQALEKDPRYGVMPLPPAMFTEYMCLENSSGIPPPKLPRVWEYLRGISDLSGFGDLPILTTIWGSVVPLRSCQGAFRVTVNDRLDSESMLQKLGPVLKRAGIVVFRMEDNDKHKYLEAKSGPFSNSSVISAFVKSSGSLSSMTFDSSQASTLTEVILSHANEFSSAVMSDLGLLRIWPSFGVAHGESGLICAQGNQMIEGGYDIRNLGDSHNVIQGIFSITFQRMGARSVYLTDFTQERIIPRLQAKVITPLSNRNHMTAYIHLLNSLKRIATTKSGQRAGAQRLLQSGSLILARDGSVRRSDELLDPRDALLTTIYEQRSLSRFPHPEVWAVLQPVSTSLTNVRQSNQDDVLVECASTVLEEIEARPHAPETNTMARALVTKIYSRPSSANWMQSRWKIVPVSTSLTEPYASSAPNLPAYMSFSDLIYEEHRDIVWTQCGFFPSNLEPPQNCREVWTDVGLPGIHAIVDHLHTLAKDLAPKWTSDNEQLQLQLTLMKTYSALNKYANKSVTHSETLSDLLDNVTVPYLYNSFEKEMSDPEAWYRPNELILDVENPTATHSLVHSKLTQFRAFLTAAHVCEMFSVETKVYVAPKPNMSEFMTMLCTLFETQDRSNGFMDVCFRFQPGFQDIYAHKLVLVHWSEYFKTRFLGSWAGHVTRDPNEPMVDVIDMSKVDKGGEVSYAAFWGILYYLYSHDLTPWNGPPTLAQQSATGPASKADDISERVQYLLSLLARADEYEITRLKDLIAKELVERKTNIVHGNVFDVCKHAELAQCTVIVDHCEEYIKENALSLKTFIAGEIAELQAELQNGGHAIGGREDAEKKVAEWKENLEAIDQIALK